MPYGVCEGFGNGKQYKSNRIDDDYSYYNDYEVMKAGRRRNAGWRRTASAAGHHAPSPRLLLLSAMSALLLVSTLPSKRLDEGCICA